MVTTEGGGQRMDTASRGTTTRAGSRSWASATHLRHRVASTVCWPCLRTRWGERCGWRAGRKEKDVRMCECCGERVEEEGERLLHLFQSSPCTACLPIQRPSLLLSLQTAGLPGRHAPERDGRPSAPTPGGRLGEPRACPSSSCPSSLQAVHLIITTPVLTVGHRVFGAFGGEANTAAPARVPFRAASRPSPSHAHAHAAAPSLLYYADIPLQTEARTNTVAAWDRHST